MHIYDRIDEFVDKLYSSNNASDVPFRLAIIVGQFGGYDLETEDLKNILLYVSSETPITKKTLEQLLESMSFNVDK